MEIIEKGGHNEICGGYSYSYEITFGKYGNTLKDVLKEIKEYTNEHFFGRLGDFGNPDVELSGNCWGIYVNNDIYISGWLSERSPEDAPSWNHFYTGDESETVTSIYGDGGWYCGINIYINTTASIPSNYTDKIFLVDMPYSN